MPLFFFDVRVRVAHRGRPIEAVLRKGARARDEHGARRTILGHYLDRGFQVLRLERAGEPAGDHSGEA